MAESSLTDLASESDPIDISPNSTKVSEDTKEETSLDPVAVQTYCRIRGLQPWEGNKLGIRWEEKTVRNYGLSTTSTNYTFTDVFGPEKANEDTFQEIAKPMVEQVIEGFNSILLAYGQTGSGKTYTMLGKPFTKNGKDLIGAEYLKVIGLIPRSLCAFLEHPQVSCVTLKALEAYGSHPAKIKIYDLLSKQNQSSHWGEKVGNGTFNVKKQATAVPIVSREDAIELIQKAHAASHYAMTAKNPDSSRGHIVFVADVTVEDDNKESNHVASLVFVDLAGSEGESALGKEFATQVSQATLLARRLEAGCINMGLSDLQLIFREMMRKGKLNETSGRGVRRIVKPYFHSNVHIGVVFCLSPAFAHCSQSEATLKFAYQACQLKTAPTRAKKKVDWPTMVLRLEKEIEYLKGIAENSHQAVESAKEKFELIFEAVASYLEIYENPELVKILKESSLIEMFDERFKGRTLQEMEIEFGMVENRRLIRTETSEERQQEFLDEVMDLVEREMEFQAVDNIIIEGDGTEIGEDIFDEDVLSHDIIAHEDYDVQVAEDFMEETGITMASVSENPTIVELSTANTILKMKLKLEQILSGRADPTEMIHDAFDLMDKNGDGLIDREEFKDICDSLNLDLNDTEHDELFDLVDEDHNGILDKSEVEKSLIPELVKIMGGTKAASRAQIEAKVAELQQENKLQKEHANKLSKVINQLQIEIEDLNKEADSSSASMKETVCQLEQDKQDLQVELERVKRSPSLANLNMESDGEMVLKVSAKDLYTKKCCDLFIGAGLADQIHGLFVNHGRLICILSALFIIAAPILGFVAGVLVEATMFFMTMLILGGGMWIILSQSILTKLLKTGEVYQILLYWVLCSLMRSDDIGAFFLFGLSLILGAPLIAFVDAAPREIAADVIIVVGSALFIYFLITTIILLTDSKNASGGPTQSGSVYLTTSTIYVFCSIHLMLILVKEIIKFMRDGTRFLLWKSSLRIENVVFFE